MKTIPARFFESWIPIVPIPVISNGLGGPELKLIPPAGGSGLGDLFAAFALAGLLASPATNVFPGEDIFKEAWRMAEEMVRTRPPRTNVLEAGENSGGQR